LSYNNSLSIFDDAFLGVDHRFNEIKRKLHFSEFPKFNQVDLGLNGDIVTEGNEKKFKLNVPVGNFSPEDVKVSLKDWVMTIEAKTEQKTEDGCARSYREVSRKFTLPRNLDMKEVTSILTPDGILKIEAPVPQKTVPPPRVKDLEIPILRE
jgi:HSP20 family molecular chaperone IbpA